MDTQINNRAKTLDGTTVRCNSNIKSVYDDASHANNVPTEAPRKVYRMRADKPMQQSLQEYLADIELASVRATRVCTHSSGSGRQEEAKHEAIQVLPIIQEAVRFLGATLPDTIEIATTFDRMLPAVMLDGSYIHQVLINLCINAVHAMRASGGHLKIAVTSTTLDCEAARHIADLKAGRYLMITVSDTGHGMDYETLQHIFEPFFTTKKAEEGTGLGLFIVDYIVTKHGGSINVSSERGQGTTCTVYLPAVNIEPLRAPNVNALAPNDCRKHILFIDDDYLLVQLSTRKLQLLNYAVSSFQRPEEALQAFRANPYQFDAVIMDHYMPGIDGQELTHQMLRLRPDLPVIMLSGYIRPEDAQRMRHLGVREVLVKSDALKRINEVLCSILGSSEVAQKAIFVGE